MIEYEKRLSISPIRSRRHRSKYVNENGQISDRGSTNPYRRNYVRFRKSSSRSRSRDTCKSSRSRDTCKSSRSHSSSIDYRKKLLFLLLQLLACLHLCSIIYCHHQRSSFVVQYTIITLILFSFLAFSCVQYDTQQAEYGGLLFGENPLLFLIWYGGMFGGGLALWSEKHRHLRSEAFTFRLRIVLLFNRRWPFLTYILYMCLKEFSFIEASGASSSSPLSEA